MWWWQKLSRSGVEVNGLPGIDLWQLAWGKGFGARAGPAAARRIGGPGPLAWADVVRGRCQTCSMTKRSIDAGFVMQLRGWLDELLPVVVRAAHLVGQTKGLHTLNGLSEQA